MSQELTFHGYRCVRLFIATFFLINTAAAFVFFLYPSKSVRGYFLNEDSLIESLTAGVFFCAFLFATILLFVRRNQNIRDRNWLILLSMLSLTAALDEISFGERLFNLEMPTLKGIKIDGVHDFFGLGVSLMDKVQSGPLLIVSLLLFITIVFGAIAIAFLKYRNRQSDESDSERDYSISIMMAIFLVVVLVSQVLDEKLLLYKKVDYRYLSFAEEMLELSASFALLTICFIVYRHRPVENAGRSGISARNDDDGIAPSA